MEHGLERALPLQRRSLGNDLEMQDLSMTRLRGDSRDSRNSNSSGGATSSNARRSTNSSDKKSELSHLLFDSWLNVLLFCFPFAIISHLFSWSSSLTFTLCLLCIAPLAERLGFITEQLALHTNETTGGFLNATFGNATELLIAVFALIKGATVVNDEPAAATYYVRLVQVSLIGSVLSNLLLVFGTAILCGSLRYRQLRIRQRGAYSMVVVLLLTISVFYLPQVLGQASDKDAVLQFSRICSIFMCLVYLVYLCFQLCSHKYYFENSDPDTTPRRVLPEGGDISPVSVEETVSFVNEFTRENDEETPVLRWYSALVALGLVSLLVSLLSELLVGAIKEAATTLLIPSEFMSAILIPVVGNAAEHTAALYLAYRGKIDAALGIAVGSAVQISVFVFPTQVLFAWALSVPLDFGIGQYETAVFMVSVICIAAVVNAGETHYLQGFVLTCTYLFIAIGYWMFY